MTVEPWFVDTNVLVYVFDADSPGKQAQARRLLDEHAHRIIARLRVVNPFRVDAADRVT